MEYDTTNICNVLGIAPIGVIQVEIDGANVGPIGAFEGKNHTEESKRAIARARTGRKWSDEYKKRMSNRLKGRFVSEETRRKMSESSKGQTFSEESREKMRKAAMGRKHSPETRAKMSATRRAKHEQRNKEASTIPEAAISTDSE
jgi:hypothetical protein